ncbi:uncharacterized protein METZ01_LOCUS79346 [marine metagenome]|uniref:Uncharacterized protein n=1 Tax=marine metagenome TaxID=408172 RepID=A0A381UE44_9ZZZZ
MFFENVRRACAHEFGTDDEPVPVDGHSAAETVSIHCIISGERGDFCPSTRVGAVHINISRGCLVAWFTNENLAIAHGDRSTEPDLSMCGSCYKGEDCEYSDTCNKLSHGLPPKLKSFSRRLPQLR